MRTKEQNGELDFCIAEFLGITINELDSISLKVVEALREYYINVEDK